MGWRDEATGKGCRRQCEGKRRHGRCRRGSMADVHSFGLMHAVLDWQAMHYEVVCLLFFDLPPRGCVPREGMSQSDVPPGDEQERYVTASLRIPTRLSTKKSMSAQ